MPGRAEDAREVAARALGWLHARQAAVCDVREPWAHGTVLRATRFPGYYDFNLVRVEDDAVTSATDLEAFADEALAGLEHRRVDFDSADVGERLRPDFEARGWRTLRLLVMRHRGSLPELPVAPAAVEEVPYDAVRELRVAWHGEDFGEADPSDYMEQSRAVALGRGARVFAVRRDGALVAYAQLEGDRAGAEVAQVYVGPEHRGAGLGTALTCAAIEAAGPVGDLWICADDEDRPKELYARLGFRAAWTLMEVTRLP